MASVTIQQTGWNGGTAKNLYCRSVNISGSRNVTAIPNINRQSTPVEVQTKAYENEKIVLNAVMFDPNLTTVTYADITALKNIDFDGTNPITLTITYGNASLGGQQTITKKCVLTTYSLPIDASDSQDGYLPMGTLSFIETGTSS